MSGGNDNAVSATFVVGDLPAELRVTGFHGTEGISQLFQFELELACTSDRLAFEGVVGRPALLTLAPEAGPAPFSVENPRYVQGIVARFVQHATHRTHTVYRATLVPRAWRLFHRHDCRIFQKMGAAAIITEVLDAGGVEHRFHSRGGEEPAEREYCVQYRESDWNFVTRLLEEEGYYYYFTHEPGRHVLHMADDRQFHPEIDGQSVLDYRPPDTTMAHGEHVHGFLWGESVRTGKVTLCDYNFKRPDLDQRVAEQADKDPDLESYDYPGLYRWPGPGKRRAQVVLEEARAPRLEGEGQSSCTRFLPGHLFTLAGHPRDDLAGRRLLLTRVEHRGEKAATELDSGLLDLRITYDNTFLCMPRDVPFRPPRLTRRPVVHGVQTAMVVGPENEEIYTDEHGRVKVHFHWDRLDHRDENSSCWIRVSQLWAGQGWGAMWIPRIGHEVIVEFEEGDPDRPIITGRVYHGINPPPYDLPGDKTRSTIKSNSSLGGDGFNEIRFEDKKGQEEIFTHAEHDQNEQVEHDMTTWVGRDQDLKVDRHRTTTVGGNRRELVIGHQKVRVKKTQNHTVHQTSHEQVGLAKTLAIGAAYNVTVGAAMAVTVGASLVKSVVDSFTQKVGLVKRVEVGQRIELVCGDSKIVMTPSEIDIKGKLVKINS